MKYHELVREQRIEELKLVEVDRKILNRLKLEK